MNLGKISKKKAVKEDEPEEINYSMTALMILEIMGRPKEHLIESLDKIIDDINKEKNVKVTNKKINEPTEIENQKNLFTTFAEIEIKVENAMVLSSLMFKYMPSHIEVIEPEHFIMQAHQYSEILTEITRKMHQYDEVLRIYQMEKIANEKKLNNQNNK